MTTRTGTPELDRRAYFAGPGIRCYALPTAGYALQMGNHRKYVVAAHKGEDRARHSQSALSSSLIPLPPQLLLLAANSALVGSRGIAFCVRFPTPALSRGHSCRRVIGPLRRYPHGSSHRLVVAYARNIPALEQSWKEHLIILSDSEGDTILIHQADSRPALQEHPFLIITSPHPMGIPPQ